MALNFQIVTPPAGVVTQPFVADPDPNSFAPAQDRILEIPDRTEHGEFSFGVKFYVKFTNGSAGASIDIVPWARDEATGNWSKAVAETGVEDFDLLISPDLAPASVFFQIIAISGTIDFVQMYGAPA